MKTLLAITTTAVLMRLAMLSHPTATAAVAGALALSAAAYGLWSHGRAHLQGWRLAGALLALGLAGNGISTILAAGTPSPALAAPVPTAFALAGNLFALAGLVVLLHQRLPGHSAESVAAATIAAAALGFSLLALVVVPAHGWQPARQLPALAIPLSEIIILYLAASLISLTGQRPGAYRYFIAAVGCLLVAHAVGVAVLFGDVHVSSVPLDVVALWGVGLWGLAMAHPSQRRPFDPVPLRSPQPGWTHVALILLAVLVVPAVLTVQLLLRVKTDVPLTAGGAALLPVVAVVYLLYHVFARSVFEYRVHHDDLTGVGNRGLFQARLETSLADSRRTGRGFAVMFLDLDRFKSINDSLGHAVGNQLLQSVVQRLRGRLRAEDTLARVGGDEFTILFPNVTAKETCHHLAEQILGVFAEPFHIGGKLLPVQTSIGVAFHPADGADAETLLKNADTAMYQAKAAGRNTYSVYDAAMSARAQLRFALETSLRSALELGQLSVHYQPKFDACSEKLIGAEALVRWQHSQLGFIPPSVFIPLAEETRLIASLGEWVLETACRQARAWQEQGLPRFSVAVNVSPRQFERQSIVKMVADVLDRTGLDPTLLELEVTESVLVEHVEDTAASLAELRAMGVRCSIDDFGTGYSALTYLTQIPADAIKIDPSFVRRIDSEPEAAPIVGAVIALAHSLNMHVVAEGVETCAQLRFLQEQGCDEMQGFLFSPPVKADHIESLLRNQPPWPQAPDVVPGGTSTLSGVVAPERLAAILAGVSTSERWTVEPDDGAIRAVLDALQPEQLALGGSTGVLRARHARVAVGTVAGLASLTGAFGATGALPAAAQITATGVLHQVVGVAPPAPPASASGLVTVAAQVPRPSEPGSPVGPSGPALVDLTSAPLAAPAVSAGSAGSAVSPVSTAPTPGPTGGPPAGGAPGGPRGP